MQAKKIAKNRIIAIALLACFTVCLPGLNGITARGDEIKTESSSTDFSGAALKLWSDYEHSNLINPATVRIDDTDVGLMVKIL